MNNKEIFKELSRKNKKFNLEMFRMGMTNLKQSICDWDISELNYSIKLIYDTIDSNNPGFKLIESETCKKIRDIIKIPDLDNVNDEYLMTHLGYYFDSINESMANELGLKSALIGFCIKLEYPFVKGL